MANYGRDAAGKPITSVQVGVSPATINGWVRADVVFRGYEAICLPRKGGEYVESPLFSCLGRDWTIRISFHNSTYLKIHLCYSHSKRENIFAGISIQNLRHWSNDDKFVTTPNDILRNLVGGALWIEIRMRMTRCRFIIDSLASQTLGKMLMNKELTDVVFVISGDEDESSNEVGEHKIETSEKSDTKFYAHRLVLVAAAPQLAELCISDKSPSLIELSDVSPAVFEVLLLYIYGGKKYNFGEDIAYVKAIIEAANKYAVINLKLDAEAYYILTFTFTSENVIEHLRYAESKNCALLKEAAVEFILDSELLSRSMSFRLDILRDVAIEISAAVGRKERNVEELWTESINDLRRKAHEKGLEVDGSREMLIAALESEANSE